MPQLQKFGCLPMVLCGTSATLPGLRCHSHTGHWHTSPCSLLLARRYMVVLRLGGLYADMDTECKKPLNDLIEPHDTMLVGWENEFPNMDHARFRSYARERQVTAHCCVPSAGVQLEAGRQL